MGKYMRRKCRGAAGEWEKARAGMAAAVERRARVVVVGDGVRTTRSRSAAAVSKRRQHATTAARVAAVEEALGRDTDDGGAAGCYLHLRSRRLFMAAAAVVAPRGPGLEEDASLLPVVADSGEVVVAGVSRCSSTASSVDYVAAVRERSGGEAEARESRDVERSSGSGGRKRREGTPSSDAESSRPVTGEQKHQRRSSPSSATSFYAAAARARSPPADEIEGFFAAAEKAAAERFAARYKAAEKAGG